MDHTHRTQTDFGSLLNRPVIIIDRARNQLEALVELVGLTSSFLFLSFESCNGWLDLRHVIIYDINLLVDPVKLMKKKITFSLQLTFGLLESSFGATQQFDFATG